MGKIKSGVALGSPGLADMKPSRPSLQLLTVWRRRPRTCTHTHTHSHAHVHCHHQQESFSLVGFLLHFTKSLPVH